MRKLLLILAVVLSWPSCVHAQGTHIASFPSDPATCDPTRGTLYYNTTTNTVKACGPAINTWTSIGGITSVASLPGTCTPGVTASVSLTINGVSYGVFYCKTLNVWAPDNPNQTISPLAYGAKWDVKYLYDCTYTLSTTINCNGGEAPFTATDVGKISFGTIGGGDTNSEPTSTVACPQGTITAVSSATQIVVSAACTITCTPSATVVCPFAYGTADDTTAINNAAAAAWNGTVNCNALQLPGGAAFFSAQIMANNAGVGSACQSGNFTEGGADITSVGPVVFGAGNGATTLIPLPNFTFPCTGGVSGKACIFGIGNGQAHGFSINGLQQAMPSSTHNVNLFELTGTNGNVGACPGGFTGHDLGLSGWGIESTSSTGFAAGVNGCNGPDIWNINVMKFGALPCQITVSGAINPFTSMALVCLGGTAGIINVNGSGTFNSYGGSFGALLGNFTAVLAAQNGATFNSYGDTFRSGNAGLIFNVINQNGFSGNINLFRSTISLASNAGATSHCIFLNASSVLHIRDSTVTCTGTNNQTFSTSATDKIFDDGGNTFTKGSVADTITAGTVFGSLSASGATLATGNVAITTCGTSTASAFSGTSTKGQFTVTFAGTPGTSCTATVTFPTPFPLVAPICTWTDVGGTNAFPTSIVNGTTSTTSTAMTETATAFTNANTEILQYSCAVP